MTGPTTTPRTTTTARAPDPPVPIGVRAIGWSAAVGTLPYLALKLSWLSGGELGVADPTFLSDPGIVVANAVTFAMDLVALALALALTHRWGDRLPAWLVLLPMWVGSGFLVPMAVLILPRTLIAMLIREPGPDVFAPWLQPLVYGGFAWQGVFLTAAFVAHAVRRWSGVVTAATPVPPPLVPLLRALVAGGCAMAASSALLHLVAGLAAGSAPALGMATGNAALAIVGAAGTVALVRTRTIARWAAAAAAWTGSAAMFSWGLHHVVVVLTVPAMTGDAAAFGTAQVTGLLGGFALAVAGLLALVGPGERRRG